LSEMLCPKNGLNGGAVLAIGHRSRELALGHSRPDFC
jgi:hypothetical protein